jgi:hypothetical protein
MMIKMKGDAIVSWQRDYKTYTKKFRNDPSGAPENAMIKARKWARKYNIDYMPQFRIGYVDKGDFK